MARHVSITRACARDLPRPRGPRARGPTLGVPWQLRAGAESSPALRSKSSRYLYRVRIKLLGK
eukprot:2840364-Prymnesium_polylepis.1